MFPILENTANEFVERVNKLTTQDVINTNNNTKKAKRKFVGKDEIDSNNNRTSKDNNKVDIGEVIENAMNKKENKESNKTTVNCSEDVKTNLNEKKDSVVDAEKLLGGYTADAIVPCAFGIKSNVMYNPEDPFAVALHAFYEMSLFNIFEK